MDQSRLDELIDKYAFGEITTEEWEELMEWYRSMEIGAVEWPSDNLNERDQLRQRMLHRLQQDIQPVHQPRKITQPVRQPRKVIHLRVWQVAASLIILVSTFLVARRYPGPKPTPAFLTANNPSGKIRALLLPDSSRVWLNAASSIRYAQTFGKEGQREIYLEGEGFFDVVSDPDHSFVVHAGTLTTTVLGTSFDVKSFAEESTASVTVIRGKVGVKANVGAPDILTPARQLALDTRTGKSTVATIDTTVVMGWREGKLLFSGQPMEEIAASLGRWYNVHFIFANPAISHCRYYLNFENTIPLQQLLAALKQTTDLDFQQDAIHHTVTISGAACQ